MPVYDTYPAVDENYNFPPEILAALSGSVSWQKTTELLTSSNLETLPSGAYRPISTTAAASLGLPRSTNGTLIKHQWSNMGMMLWAPITANELWMRSAINTDWTPWINLKTGASQRLYDAETDIDSLEDGIYTPMNVSAAETMGFPSKNVGPLHQFTIPGGTPGKLNSVQWWFPISGTAKIWTRSRISGSWFEWTEIGGSSKTPLNSPEREMRVAQANARRLGPQGTNGVAVFAMMFDHGTNNFVSKIAPKLKAAGLPCGLGLNSQMYDPTYMFNEHDKNTTFAQIQTLAISQGVSIWNHGQRHVKSATEIVGGRDELNQSMPMVPIENWLNAGPYSFSTSFEAYWTDPDGATIMNSHGYVIGNIDERVKPLNGIAKPGFDGTWIDAGQNAIDILKSEIQEAQRIGGAAMMRHHPQYMDTTGYVTSAQFQTFIDWVASERDAGRLMVVTPDMLNLLDSGKSFRPSLTDGSGGSGKQDRTVKLSQHPQNKGMVAELSATVKLTSAGTIRLSATTTGLSSIRDVAIPAGVWVDLKSYFTIPLNTTTDLTLTVQNTTGAGLTVNSMNLYAG